MPGKAEYWYVLRLQGDAALKEAQQFASAVQKELNQIQATANIVLRAKIDTKATQSQAMTQAQQLEQELKKGMARAQRDFSTTATRFGAQQFTSSFRAMWEQGTIAPSTEAITKIRKAQGALTDLGKVAKKMGVTTDDLINMSSLDRAVTAVQAVQRRMWGLRGLGYQLESYGRGMTQTAAVMGGTMALASKKYLDFAAPLGKAARNLDLNAELTEVLDKKLTQLAGTVSMMTPQEQAEGLYLWAAATGAVVDSEEELMAVLGQADKVQRLALLGNIDYGTAVEATTDILAQYQLNMSETDRVVNTLIKVAAVSKAEVGDLAQAFTFAGARADQANTSFEDTAAVFQLLSAYGLRGSRAGRGLGMLFENLIAPSTVAKKELDELFETVFGRTDVLETAEGEFVGMAEAIGTLAEATANLTEVEKAEFVAKLTSQNASRALVPLLELEQAARLRGISAIEATSIMLRGAANDAERETVRIFTNMMRNLQGYTVDSRSAQETSEAQWSEYAAHVSGQAEFIKASFDAAIVDIGREMTTVLLPIMQDVADLARKIASYVGEHPDAAKIVLGLTAGIGLAGLLVTAVGKGVRLVADIKTMAMATTMYKAAQDNIKAATMELASAEMKLQAAGMNAAGTGSGVVSGLRGAIPVAEGGLAAGALSGTAGAGIIGIIVAAVAALVGWKLASDAAIKADKEHAAVMAVGTENYDSYIQRLKDAKMESYAVTEATYDMIKAKEDSDDAFGQQEAIEYATAMADARIEIEKTFAALSGTRLSTLRGIPGGRVGEDVYQALIANYVRNVMPDLLKGADEYTLSLMSQREVLSKILVANNFNADVAQAIAGYMADAAKYSYAMQIREPISERPPEELAYEYLANPPTPEVEELGDEVDETADAMDELAEATERAKTALQRFLDQVGPVDEKMLAMRSTILEQIAALDGMGDGLRAGHLYAALLNVETGLKNIRGVAIDLGIEEGANRGIQSIEDLAAAAQSAAASAWDDFAGLIGTMSDTEILGLYEDYLAELDATLTAAALMDENAADLYVRRWQETWDARVDGYKDAEDEITKAAEDAQRDRERFLEEAQSGFENLVKAALKPTSVTGLDMLQTDIGAYADKWDEAARRMRAAMEDPGGEWGWMIPEHIKAQGLDAAKAWGANWIDEFYAGMHPDQIDWPSFVDAFKQSLQRQAAQENLVQVAIAELAKEGITATSEEVLAALGLQSPMQQMFLGGLTPEQAASGLSNTMGGVVSNLAIEEGAFDTAATSVSGAFTTALDTKIGESSLPNRLNAIWTKQMTDTPDPIIAVGKAAGALFWNGFEDSLEGSTFVDRIVIIALDALREAIGAT